jgi:putative ABC transport system substrate-binding protein
MRGSSVGGVFLALGLLYALLTAAEAQQTKQVFRVGVLSIINLRSASQFVAFAQRLQELRYVEGQNVAFEFRNAEEQAERLADLAAELVRLQVDVIVAPGPEATLQAARQATSTIPTVMLAINYHPMEA